jgi:hypothetical protein
MSNGGPDTSGEGLTLLARVELCEQGLTAIETILRATFPQFFDEHVTDVAEGENDNGHEETISGSGEGSGETEKEASEEETGEETDSEEAPEKGSEETTEVVTE